MNFIGVGLGIAIPSMDEAKLDDSLRPNQIVFRPHEKSISIKCEEPPRNPNFSADNYWIPSQLLCLDSQVKASLPCKERKGKAPPGQPLCELQASGHGKEEAPSGQLKPGPDKSNSPISRFNEKKPKSSSICEPDNTTAGDIKLSEYHTCIRTHGPITKTPNILADMVRECDRKTVPAGSSGFLSHCFHCSKMLQEGKDIFFCRDKAFCSFQCQWMEIFSCGLGESFERSLRDHPRR